MQIPVQTKIGMKRRFDWFYLVIASSSVCNLGNYAVMTILAIYFVRSLGLTAAQAGALLLFTSLSFRLSRLFLAPMVNRLPTRLAMAMALFLTSAGYWGLAFVRTPLLVVFLLFVIGSGHSTNALIVKTVAAQTKNTGGSKQSPFLRYASLTTGINLAAAIGASIGGTLLFHWGATSVFFLAAICYTISALIAISIPPAEAGVLQSANWALALRLTLKQSAIWRALLFTFLGWFLYTQSYASLPLFVSEAVHRPDLLGSTFTLNAVLVVAGQLPISKMVIYFRLPTSQLATLGFLIFGGGFLLLWFFPSWQIVYVAVAFWTLGEMLLMPALDTLVAEGALVEYRQVAFSVSIVAVALGEGLGNLFGVSLGGSLLKSGNLSSLYTILTFVAVGATVMSIFVVKRRESIIFRLLSGQSPIPTGQTQLLQAEQGLMEKTGLGQSLLMWLSAGSYHEDRSIFEAHPELVALNTGELEHFIDQHPEQSGREMLADRLDILRSIRSRIKMFIRVTYVNMYGGLILDLPKWLEEIKQQLVDVHLDKEENPGQTAAWRMVLLKGAILRARGMRSIAPEIIAELQVLYAIAALEADGPEYAEVVENAIASLQEALNIYTLAQYPYQYARTQVFLSMAYQRRVKGSRRANLEQALACYQAANQAYKSDPFPMPVAATQVTGSLSPNQRMRQEKIAELEQAMAHCQITLQNVIERENIEGMPTQRLGSLPEDLDPDKTLLVLRSRSKPGIATHVEWLASQSTQRLLPKDLVNGRTLMQKDEN